MRSHQANRNRGKDNQCWTTPPVAAPEVTYADFEACNGFDVMERLTEIQAPVLVVTAEDDKMTPPKYGDFLESGIPSVSRAHITAAGHFMPVEQPKAFNQAVIDFLDTISR